MSLTQNLKWSYTKSSCPSLHMHLHIQNSAVHFINCTKVSDVTLLLRNDLLRIKASLDSKCDTKKIWTKVKQNGFCFEKYLKVLVIQSLGKYIPLKTWKCMRICVCMSVGDFWYKSHQNPSRSLYSKVLKLDEIKFCATVLFCTTQNFIPVVLWQRMCHCIFTSFKGFYSDGKHTENVYYSRLFLH